VSGFVPQQWFSALEVLNLLIPFSWFLISRQFFSGLSTSVWVTLIFVYRKNLFDILDSESKLVYGCLLMAVAQLFLSREMARVLPTIVCKSVLWWGETACFCSRQTTKPIRRALPD
jgi:hypothetical protein